MDKVTPVKLTETLKGIPSREMELGYYLAKTNEYRAHRMRALYPFGVPTKVAQMLKRLLISANKGLDLKLSSNQVELSDSVFNIPKEERKHGIRRKFLRATRHPDSLAGPSVDSFTKWFMSVLKEKAPQGFSVKLLVNVTVSVTGAFDIDVTLGYGEKPPYDALNQSPWYLNPSAFIASTMDSSALAENYGYLMNVQNISDVILDVATQLKMDCQLTSFSLCWDFWNKIFSISELGKLTI